MRNGNANRRRAGGSFVALGCVGFIASAPALAQDAANSEPTRLEGVTVTDTAVEEYKVEELSSPKATAPILDTPRVVNVITEEVLQDTASFSFEDALRTVPGITLGAGEGGTANADIPLIRGVDATGDVFIDGARDIGAQNREAFAIETVEVFKGPSTAFGGRGAAGGAINVVSKLARRGNFGSVQATAGTSNLIRVTGDVNAQVHDDIAVRVVGLFHDSEVAGRDEVFDDRWGIAPSVTVGAGGPITASVSYYHLETDAMPDYGIPLTSPGQLPGGVREPTDVDYDTFYGLLDRDFQKTQVDAFGFHFDAQLAPGLILSNVTRYSDTAIDYIVTNPDDSTGNVQNGFVWRFPKSRNSSSSGVVSNTNLAAIFETGGIGHSLSAGVEFNDTEAFNTPYVVDAGSYRFNADAPGSGCNAQGLAENNCTTLTDPDPRDPWSGAISASPNPARAHSDEVSFYLFDSIQLAPSLILNGGIRWTDFSASGSGCGRGGCFDVENDSDFWSYQAGAIFKPTEATSLYASYANSRTPPGTTVGEGAENIGANDDLYRPAQTENWEIGAKAELLGGALLLTGAAFRIDRGNILPIDPVVDSQIIQAARLQGFEVGATGIVGPVSMLVGYTYIDSELRQDAFSEDGDPGNDAQSAVGNRLPQTPVHNVAATLDWQVLPQLSIGAGAYGASERYADGNNLIRADGYVRFDAHAQFDFSENLTARLNVNNVLDERYVIKLRNPHFAIPAAGRQAIVSITARY